MINNHMLMGENFLKYSRCESIDIINRNRFIWGNVKPDCVLKYKRMKHYYDESIDTIIKKIYFLSLLTLDDFYYRITPAKFSEELGIVCHFLCDFFCAPHYYRWECRSTKSTKEHMLYEKRLAKRTKSFVPEYKCKKDLEIKDIREFLEVLQKEYDGNIDYNNDLEFSYYVCESIINAIFKQIHKNKKPGKKAV